MWGPPATFFLAALVVNLTVDSLETAFAGNLSDAVVNYEFLAAGFARFVLFAWQSFLTSRGVSVI